MKWLKSILANLHTLIIRGEGSFICIICLDYQMGKLTKREARRALMEFISSEEIDAKHIMEVAQIIEDAKEGEDDEQV